MCESINFFNLKCNWQTLSLLSFILTFLSYSRIYSRTSFGSHLFQILFYLINVFLFVLQIDHSFPFFFSPHFLSQLPYICLLIHFHFTSLLLLCLYLVLVFIQCGFALCSERGRPTMMLSKAWHIKLRQEQAPPSASRLGEVIHHREQVPKSQLNTRDRS